MLAFADVDSGRMSMVLLFRVASFTGLLRVVTTSTLATLKQLMQRYVLCYDERTGDRTSSRDGSSAPRPAARLQRLHFASIAGQRTGRPADDARNCAGCSGLRDDIWQTG